MIQCWNVPIKKESCQSKETVAHPGRHPCGCPCAGVCGHVCLAVCSERQNGFRQGSHGSHWGLKTPPTGDITTKGTPDLRVDIRNKSHTNRRERDWGCHRSWLRLQRKGRPLAHGPGWIRTLGRAPRSYPGPRCRDGKSRPWAPRPWRPGHKRPRADRIGRGF